MDNLSSDIIIAGAGPTGLMLANQLTRFNITYIILDQKAGPTDESRALIVHSRSMEIYQQLGLSDQILAEGETGDGLALYKEGKLSTSLALIDPEEKSSPFPFIMMYEQSKNETLLYGNLLAKNKDVQWNTLITAIEKSGDGYELKAVQKDGEVMYQCKYLVACDGGKSLIRDFSKVPFKGGTYLNVFYVADTHIKAGLASKKLSIFLTKKSITMLFPMKGEQHFRALGILPKEYYHRDDIPFEEVLAEIKKDMQIPVEFYNTGWHSTYKLHHKKVERFSTGGIFFAGDAAHVHSPAGGQGMNTGLQDAYNLAWKLALVQTGKAGPRLLNTYDEERNPVAEDLLKTTDRLFSAMITDSKWFSFLRLYLVPVLITVVNRIKPIRRRLFRTLSQIDISYLSSSLSKGEAGEIKAGMRCPYFFLNYNEQVISVYDLLKEKAVNPFTILLYNTGSAALTKLNTSLFNIVIINCDKRNDISLKQAGLPRSFVMVVRPDNYIGYISRVANANEICDFMEDAYFLHSSQKCLL